MPIPKIEELILGRNLQLDNSSIHEAFGEVNVTRTEKGFSVVATVLMNPQDSAEGWQTGMAIDTSYSMKPAFGGQNCYFTHALTAEEIQRYSGMGLIEVFDQDGQPACHLLNGAYEKLLEDGVLQLVEEPNQVQDICRKVVPMLAGKLDADGGTTVIYWAQGADGSGFSVLGDLEEEQAATAEYQGPQEGQWGNGTRLLPAIKYFLNTFRDAPMGFYVFVTDGRLDDFEEVKEFTIQLAHDIANKKTNPVKLVLIGVGNEIDEKQLEDLDDLPDTCDLPVDIWDHKIAKEMRSLLDIFAEMVDENQILAPSAELLDDQGNLVRSYTDGMPALLRFELPASAKGFRISLPNGVVIEQAIIR